MKLEQLKKAVDNKLSTIYEYENYCFWEANKKDIWNRPDISVYVKEALKGGENEVLNLYYFILNILFDEHGKSCKNSGSKPVGRKKRAKRVSGIQYDENEISEAKILGNYFVTLAENDERVRGFRRMIVQHRPSGRKNSRQDCLSDAEAAELFHSPACRYLSYEQFMHWGIPIFGHTAKLYDNPVPYIDRPVEWIINDYKVLEITPPGRVFVVKYSAPSINACKLDSDNSRPERQVRLEPQHVGIQIPEDWRSHIKAWLTTRMSRLCLNHDQYGGSLPRDQTSSEIAYQEFIRMADEILTENDDAPSKFVLTSSNKNRLVYRIKHERFEDKELWSDHILDLQRCASENCTRKVDQDADESMFSVGTHERLEDEEVWLGSFLDELRVLGEDLARKYHWDKVESMSFVLTGKPPVVHPIQARTTITSLDELPDAFIDMQILPWVSWETLEKLYKDEQLSILGGDNKPRGKVAYMVFDFVTREAGPNIADSQWRELFERWNSMSPNDIFARASDFKQSYQRAKKSLLGRNGIEYRMSPSEYDSLCSKWRDLTDTPSEPNCDGMKKPGEPPS